MLQPSLLLAVPPASVKALHAELQLELLVNGDAVVHGATALAVLHRHEVVFVS